MLEPPLEAAAVPEVPVPVLVLDAVEAPGPVVLPLAAPVVSAPDPLVLPDAVEVDVPLTPLVLLAPALAVEPLVPVAPGPVVAALSVEPVAEVVVPVAATLPLEPAAELVAAVVAALPLEPAVTPAIVEDEPGVEPPQAMSSISVNTTIWIRQEFRLIGSVSMGANGAATHPNRLDRLAKRRPPHAAGALQSAMPKRLPLENFGTHPPPLP